MIFEYFNENLKSVAEFVSNKFPKDTKYKINIAIESKLEYYAYDVYLEGETLYLRGYDIYALYNAADAVANALKNGEEPKCSYRLPDREEYINDPDKLYMRWIGEWEPDPRMRDYELMLENYRHPSDRLITCAHRGECFYYPENCVEAIISFYKMGGDAVELDIRTTKDGVFVLLHDSTLGRMTDWEDKKGKNGLPESELAEDWTYDQLMQLNLKESEGGDGAVVTPFKITTLAEALRICKNRLLIVPDKSVFWRYTEEDHLSDHPEFFLFDTMKETSNYDSVLISYGCKDSPKEAARIQQYIYEKTGVIPYILIRTNAHMRGVCCDLENYAIPEHWGVQINGRYVHERFPERYGESYRLVRDKGFLLWGWTICDENYSDSRDCEETWREMYGLGYRMIMTNHYLELVKFASKTINFDK